ncbi:MAG TPA: ABC-type transport auxiliary lipoprotein family protein [Rhodanobacteraceae bacterium]|nr:ABC-type transport auxiliary lipoprotein family protein [Rhodanobacteraceae bacterium]
MKFLATFVLTILLGACAALRGTPEPYTVYAPRLAPIAGNGAPVQWQLVVQTPLASDALDSKRIVVMPTPGVLQVYPNARWRDPAPALLQSLLIQAFEDSGRIVGVATTGSGLNADYALALELRAFGTEYVDGAPHAVVRLTAKLVDYGSNRMLAAKAFAADVPSAGATAADAAAGIEQALNRVLPQIVEWTMTQGNSAWIRRAPAAGPALAPAK